MRAYVPEAKLGSIRLGMATMITTDSYPGRVYHGWAGYLSPTSEFTPNTVETPELRAALVYRLRIYVCDAHDELRLGTRDPPMPPAVEPAPALRLEDVRRNFRSGKRVIEALAGITATAARGAVTGLIGPDGAGKTTLMRLIAGLLLSDSGRIEVLGVEVARDPLAVKA